MYLPDYFNVLLLEYNFGNNQTKKVASLTILFALLSSDKFGLVSTLRSPSRPVSYNFSSNLWSQSDLFTPFSIFIIFAGINFNLSFVQILSWSLHHIALAVTRSLSHTFVIANKLIQGLFEFRLVNHLHIPGQQRSHH